MKSKLSGILYIEAALPVCVFFRQAVSKLCFFPDLYNLCGYVTTCGNKISCVCNITSIWVFSCGRCELKSREEVEGLLGPLLLFCVAIATLLGFFADASQDLQTDGLTHNLQPCLHQSRQLDKAKLQSGRLSGSGLARDKKLVSSTCVIGSPPMDIPKIGHQDICGVAPGAGAKSGVESHVGLDDLQRIVTLPSNGSGEVPMLKTEDGGDFQYSCEGRIDVNSNRHGSIARNGSFSHSGSAATSIRDQRDAAVVDGTALQSIPQTQCHFDLNHDSGRASSNILHHVGKSDLQDYDATAEDEESTDANSKGDDFDGGEHGEDVLEGAMFSFAEDC